MHYFYMVWAEPGENWFEIWPTKKQAMLAARALSDEVRFVDRGDDCYSGPDWPTGYDGVIVERRKHYYQGA